MQEKNTEKIIIYTDGSARGNPGSGGWAVVFLMSGKVVEIGGKSEHATNNQMELSAPIGALKHLKEKLFRQGLKSGIEIFSDSKYVILGITEWIFGWMKEGWKNAAKKPVLNRELWEELYELAQNFDIKWTYVEGHTGNKWNERADEIATSFADGIPII